MTSEGLGEVFKGDSRLTSKNLSSSLSVLKDSPIFVLDKEFDRGGLCIYII